MGNSRAAFNPPPVGHRALENLRGFELCSAWLKENRRSVASATAKSIKSDWLATLIGAKPTAMIAARLARQCADQLLTLSHVGERVIGRGRGK
jgi:hypothetical protein